MCVFGFFRTQQNQVQTKNIRSHAVFTLLTDSFFSILVKKNALALGIVLQLPDLLFFFTRIIKWGFPVLGYTGVSHIFWSKKKMRWDKTVPFWWGERTWFFSDSYGKNCGINWKLAENEQSSCHWKTRSPLMVPLACESPFFPILEKFYCKYGTAQLGNIMWTISVPIFTPFNVQT